MVDAGDPAPDFRLPDSAGGTLGLADLAGAPAVVLFHEEAGTPDCHRQLAGFAQEAGELAGMGARVVAVSVDPPERLAEEARRLGGAFPLLSDAGADVARAYGVYDEATRRARRAAFVVDGGGVVRLANRRYSPGRLADMVAVFEALESLGAGETGTG